VTDISVKLDAIEAGLEGVTPYVVFTDGDIHLRERDAYGTMPKIGHVKMPKLVSHISRLDPTTVRELVRLARIGAETEVRRAKDAEMAALTARVAELASARDAAIVALGEWARKAGALETRVAKLEEGLAQSRTWHESEDKALSKSGRSDADYHWRRCGHADQIADIRQVLPDEEYNATLDRINARAALEATP
jgi:hypothetical protein